MRGLPPEDFEILKEFVRIKRTLPRNQDVSIDMMGKEKCKILTRILKEHSKGFIGAEMVRAAKELEEKDRLTGMLRGMNL